MGAIRDGVLRSAGDGILNRGAFDSLCYFLPLTKIKVSARSAKNNDGLTPRERSRPVLYYPWEAGESWSIERGGCPGGGS